MLVTYFHFILGYTLGIGKQEIQHGSPAIIEKQSQKNNTKNMGLIGKCISNTNTGLVEGLISTRLDYGK